MTRLVRTINRLHLIYLGLLPSLATFALLSQEGYRWPFLLFVGGTATVGVYLTVLYHYTPPHTSLASSLLTLADGPLFALAAQGGRAGFSSFLIESFLIDCLALWLAILGLTVRSPLPTPRERAASLGIGVTALAVTLSLAWAYASENLGGSWIHGAWIAGGIGEGVAMRYALLRDERTARPEGDGSILYIALLLLAWVLAMNFGIIAHAAG